MADEFKLGTIGMMLTRSGLNILSAGLSGKKIIFTRVSIGSGVMENVSTRADYEQRVLAMSDMIHFEMDIPIVECSNLGNGYMILSVRKDNAEVTSGFFARERAVWAKVEDGEEVLYAYINTGDASSFIPSNTGPVAKVIEFSVYTIVQNAANIEVNLDASFAYASLSRFLDHVNSEHPHLNTPNHYADVTTTDNFWVTDLDNHLHKISVEDTKKVLLSDLDKTVSENQQKIYEMELFNQAKNELGLEPINLLIIEDFKPITTFDEVKVKVLSCAKNGRTVGVESDSEILIGRQYIISDDVNAEIVQVENLNRVNGYINVVLENPLTNDYDLERVFLYRTTFKNVETVDKKFVSWTSGKVFKGILANVERTLEVDFDLVKQF